MKIKNLGVTDKILVILGLTLAGVMTFVLFAGVVVALLQMFMDDEPTAAIQSASPSDEPAALKAPSTEELP